MNEADMIIDGVAGPLLPGGLCPIKSEAGAVLVANAVPGDRLQVRVNDKRRGVLRGEIVEIIEPSAQRIESPCPVAASCGGCALQPFGIDDQAVVKSGWVRDAFRQLIDAETAWQPAIIDPGRKRRRVRWFVGHDLAGSFLGFYAQATHEPVRQPSCMAVTSELQQLRLLLEEQLDLITFNAVQALQLCDGIHVIFENSPPAADEVEALRDLTLPGLSLQWWWQDVRGITRPLHKPARPFHDRLPAGGAEVELAVGPDGFVQGEAKGNRELIRQIQDWAGPVRRIADLFCGIGNLSLPLAAATGAVVHGAELNPGSVRAATANAKRLGVDAHFVEANLFENFDTTPYINADLLILDPPRRGAKRICSQMLTLLPARIVMVSCDPAAGARDGELLRQAGYRLAALRALDLFPGAGHVEAMSLWERI